MTVLSAFLAMAPLVAWQQLPRQTEPLTGALAGIVRNPLNLPLAGVEVSLRDARGVEIRALTTLGDGAFRFQNVAPGAYEIRVSLSRYEAVQLSVAVQAGMVSPVEVILKPVAREAPSPPPARASPAYRTLPDAESAPPPDEAAPAAPLPPDSQVFTPAPNRWNYDFPVYHRYGAADESPFVKGNFFDPFDRNRLKGDKPIFGQTFLNISLTSDTFADPRKLPAPNGISTAQPGSYNFFGAFGQFFLDQDFTFSVDLFHGDASFRPVDWRIRFTPEVDLNYLDVQETGIVNANPADGTTRLDSHLGLQEGFVEVKLADLSPAYDFISLRAGIQSFNSDFRGFIFSDQEPGLRIFGTADSNRYQYNAAYFAMLEKDTNSGLNTMQYRNQQVFLANVYRQDFFKPGYTLQASFHYDKDDPSFEFDTNNFLVRPAPVGIVQPHSIRAYYYGLTGDGHIGRLNVNHAFYQVLGEDKLNPIAGRPMNINAQMAAGEVSLDKDWIRFRTSLFYASGQKNPLSGTARGFDAIFDNPSFAGGFFSFWEREGIRLTSTGVDLAPGGSLLPNLRSSKIEGQANFDNPGLGLWNAATDFDLTPRLKAVVNLNLIRFMDTQPLELLLFQSNIHAGVGADSGFGVVYRPALSENITISGVFNAFFPFQGFRDIYSGQTLLAVAANVRFRF
jgi:Carboxypeptidase regulatory-like domain